ncbi:MAG TPA: methyltransferase domain-containing protein [Longimicrobium sp.]|nr:methyltransferase domain-containing protein [Longimicrobium sp.]
MTDLLQPTALDARFVDTVPELYDRHLGPFLFTPLAVDLTERVIRPDEGPPRVLELAAGTGRLTEQLLAHLPAGSSVVATDLNAPMLEVAQRRLAAAGGAVAVEWRTPVDALDLPFGDGGFDAVVCQLGIMFFPDKAKAAREALRVLRPGGQWLMNVMAPLDENPLGRIVTQVVAEHFPDDPPTFFRLPFSFGDPLAMMALAHDAGFEDVDVSVVDRTVESPSAEDAAFGFVAGNPGAHAIRERGGDTGAVVGGVARALAAEYGDRPLRIPIRARVLSACKPR